MGAHCWKNRASGTNGSDSSQRTHHLNTRGFLAIKCFGVPLLHRISTELSVVRDSNLDFESKFCFVFFFHHTWNNACRHTGMRTEPPISLEKPPPSCSSVLVIDPFLGFGEGGEEKLRSSKVSWEPQGKKGKYWMKAIKSVKKLELYAVTKLSFGPLCIKLLSRQN